MKEKEKTFEVFLMTDFPFLKKAHKFQEFEENFVILLVNYVGFQYTLDNFENLSFYLLIR